jgi:hypothetical protein
MPVRPMSVKGLKVKVLFDVFVMLIKSLHNTIGGFNSVGHLATH